jgi:hypothetical protein
MACLLMGLSVDEPSDGFDEFDTHAVHQLAVRRFAAVERRLFLGSLESMAKEAWRWQPASATTDRRKTPHHCHRRRRRCSLPAPADQEAAVAVLPSGTWLPPTLPPAPVRRDGWWAGAGTPTTEEAERRFAAVQAALVSAAADIQSQHTSLTNPPGAHAGGCTGWPGTRGVSQSGGQQQGVLDAVGSAALHRFLANVDHVDKKVLTKQATVGGGDELVRRRPPRKPALDCWSDGGGSGQQPAAQVADNSSIEQQLRQSRVLARRAGRRMDRDADGNDDTSRQERGGAAAAAAPWASHRLQVPWHHHRWPPSSLAVGRVPEGVFVC